MEKSPNASVNNSNILDTSAIEGESVESPKKVEGAPLI